MTADTGDERRRRRTTGAWMPGDPPGHRQFFTFATDRRFALDSGASLTDVVDRLRDVGHARRHRQQRRAAVPRLDRRQPRQRSGRPGPSGARAGGRRWSGRASRSTPTAGSSSARTCSAGARAPPGRRRRTRPTAGRTASRFPVITIRDMVRAQARLADALGIATLARRRRRLDGRHAGAGVGDHLPAPGALDRAHRHVHAGDGAADRLGGDRAPGHHARPALAGRRVLRRAGRRRTRGRPGRRPDGRPGHVPQRQRLHRPLRSRARRPARARAARSACGSSSRSSATSSTTAPSSAGASTPTAT